jgi:putative FmdB family regulatory protein
MPIYAYRCTDCGFEDEFLQKISEPPMTLCPSCGKEAFRKQLTAAGFQLKGSGWYATDFRNKGAKPAASDESGSAKSDTKSQAKAETKSESKSETKSESKSESKSEIKTEASGASGKSKAPA